jgi:hypothetical protein
MAFMAFIIWHLSIQHLRAKPALWFKAVALGAAGPYNPRSRPNMIVWPSLEHEKKEGRTKALPP